MSKASFTSSRLLDDDDMPPPQAAFTQAEHPHAMRPPPAEPRRLAAPANAAAPPLLPAQRACYEALGLALEEGHVFATVTGPAASGKSTVLEAVLADRRNRTLRCIRINQPDKVLSNLADQIERVAYAEAGKPENLDRHVVLAIDDAHTASDELLTCLTRLAAMREPGRRVPQILLVGRPELWQRLAGQQYAPLSRRLAIRAVLPPLEVEEDPWGSLEREVSQTMSQPRAESELLPARQPQNSPQFEREYTGSHYPIPVAEAGLPLDPATVPPPTDFALFPDPPPRAVPPSHRRDIGRRLLLPLGCLLAGLAAFAFLLSFYEWPNPFEDVPLANSKPAEPFSFTPPSDGGGSRQGPSAPVPQTTATPAPALASKSEAHPPPALAPKAEDHPAPAPEPEPPPAPRVLSSAKPVAAPVVAPVSHATVSASPATTISLLLRRGEAQFALGDISAARLLFERAAEAGNGTAALRLARTYDAASLPAADAVTFGNRNTARVWYGRAAALGDKEAKARLRAMNEGR